MCGGRDGSILGELNEGRLMEVGPRNITSIFFPLPGCWPSWKTRFAGLTSFGWSMNGSWNSVCSCDSSRKISSRFSTSWTNCSVSCKASRSPEILYTRWKPPSKYSTTSGKRSRSVPLWFKVDSMLSQDFYNRGQGSIIR